MIKNEHTNLLENGRNRRRSNSGSDGGGGFEIGMHEIESMKLGGPAGDGERISSSSSSSASGSIKPTLRYKGTNYMSTSAFQTMAEEIVRQRNHMETLAKSRSHDGKTSSLYICMYVCMYETYYVHIYVCMLYLSYIIDII